MNPDRIGESKPRRRSTGTVWSPTVEQIHFISDRGGMHDLYLMNPDGSNVQHVFIKNHGGFIVEAIRENYQDPVVKKARETCAVKAREKVLEDLTSEFRIKRDNIICQAFHNRPRLVERAAEKIRSYMIRERLLEHNTAMEAYQKGGMVKAVSSPRSSVGSCLPRA